MSFPGAGTRQWLDSGAEPRGQCRRPLSLLAGWPHAACRFLHPPPRGRLGTDCLGQRWRYRPPGLWRSRGPWGGGSGVSAGGEEEGRWRRSWSRRCRPSTGVCWHVRLRRPRGWVPGPGRGRAAAAGRAPWEEPTPKDSDLGWPPCRALLPPLLRSDSGRPRILPPFLLSLPSKCSQSCSVHQPPLRSLSAQKDQLLFHYSSSPHTPIKSPTQGPLQFMSDLVVGKGKTLPSVLSIITLLYPSDSFSWDKQSIGSSTETCYLNRVPTLVWDSPEHQWMQTTLFSLFALSSAFLHSFGWWMCQKWCLDWMWESSSGGWRLKKNNFCRTWGLVGWRTNVM